MYCPLTEEPQRISAYRAYLIFLEIRIIDLYVAADCMCLAPFHFFLWAQYLNDFFPQECVSAVRGHPKVIDFSRPTIQKRVCDFLLLRHSNFGPILHNSEILQVFALMPHPYFTLILECSRCTRSPMLGSARA